MKTRFATVLFLVIFPFLCSSQNTQLNQNKELIESLQKELFLLDQELQTAKPKNQPIATSSNLDEETRNYIDEAIKRHFDRNVTYELQKSLEELKSSINQENAELRTMVEAVNSKVSRLNAGNQSGEILSMKQDLIRIQASLNAQATLTSDSLTSTPQGQMSLTIVRQEEEIKLLKGEIDKLRNELADAKSSGISEETQAELDKLRKENAGYKMEINRQQKEIDQLRTMIENLKEDAMANQQLKSLDEKVTTIQKQQEKLLEEKELAKNNTELKNIDKELDALESQNKTNMKIEKLEKEVKTLTSVIASTPIENYSDKLLKSNVGNYYLVVGSRRTKADIEQLQRDFASKKINTIIMQNSRNTWYHLCVDRFDTREEAGNAVVKYRENGIPDAWWIFNSKNN